MLKVKLIVFQSELLFIKYSCNFKIICFIFQTIEIKPEISKFYFISKSLYFRTCNWQMIKTHFKRLKSKPNFKVHTKNLVALMLEVVN